MIEAFITPVADSADPTAAPTVIELSAYLDDLGSFALPMVGFAAFAMVCFFIYTPFGLC